MLKNDKNLIYELVTTAGPAGLFYFLAVNLTGEISNQKYTFS